MITFTEESIVEMYPEMEEMFKAHYREACFYEDMEINPRLDVYSVIEEYNGYFLLVARIEEEIVGYVSYAVHPLLQFEDEIIANMELIYVVPHLRSSGIASQLLEEAERILTDEREVTVMSINMKTNTPIRGFAEAMGYEEMEVMFTKRVGAL